MNRTIENNLKASGYGFNQITPLKDNLIELLKKTKFTKFINLYDSDPGKLTKSGWHTKIQNLRKDIYADWIYTTACIYKFEDIKNYRFDETFGRYSYLEDLDFCLNLKKKNSKLIVVANARFCHPNFIERNSFDFGVTEIENRFSIVKRHNLKFNAFFIGVIIRSLISLFNFFTGRFNSINRFFGNIFGLTKCIHKIFKLKFFT